MKEMTIRPVVESDLKTVHRIERSAFKNSYPRSFLKALYRNNTQTFLVAQKEDMVIGYVIANYYGDEGHIISIAVDSSERRRHVGVKLMNSIINILKKLQVTEIRLEVRKSNIKARKFYESLGFKYLCIIPDYYGDENGLLYTLSIADSSYTM